jgi:hypothetical protein
LLVGNLVAQIDIPKSPSRTYLDYPVIDGDDLIIISDIEIPDHSAKMLQLALLTGMARGIKHLIVAGDLIATDQDSLNT